MNIAVPYPLWGLGCFLVLGGTGCTLGLNLLMVIKSKSHRLKKIGSVVLPMSFFNLNEAIIFGLPIIYNFFLIIPFILVPFINLSITYLCIFILKIVPLPNGFFIQFIIPSFVKAFLITNSFKGVLLVFLLIFIDMLVWYSFFKIYDKQCYFEECQKLE